MFLGRLQVRRRLEPALLPAPDDVREAAERDLQSVGQRPEQEVSWAQVLGVFAFVRLLSALPITPGGVGVVELGYIGGLNLAGGPHAQVVAAVLLFRVLTYGLQIPLGGFTYIIWRRKKSWFKTPPDHHVDVDEPALALTGSA